MTAPRRVACLALVVALFVLTGCWDRQELEDLGLVLALGIDSLPRDKVEVTAQIAIPLRLGAAEGGGKGGGEGLPTLAVTRSAASVPEALDAINRVINRRITLAQNRVIVFGDRTARRGLARFMTVFGRYREFRRTMQIIVVEGRAAEIMTLKPGIETNPAEHLMDLTMVSQRAGETAVSTVNDFVRIMEGHGSSPFAAYIRPPAKKEGAPPSGEEAAAGKGAKEGDESPFVGGVAVFKGDRMVGVLNPREAVAFLILASRFSGAFFTVPDPLSRGRYLVLNLTSAKPMFKTRLRAGRPSVAIEVKAEADLVATETNINYTATKNEHRIEQAAEAALEKRVSAILNRAQRDFASDPFGIGDRFRPLFPTWESWTTFNWRKRFPGVPISVAADLHMRRFGLQR